MRTYKEYLLESYKPHKYRKHPFSSEKEEKNQIEDLEEDMTNIEHIKSPSLRIQRYVIKHRPDLIKLINNLDPKLREKHKHELGLSGLDI